MTNILETIVAHKREEVESRRRRIRLSSLGEMEHFHRQRRSLRGSLESTQPFAVIAELKRSSPAAGALRTNLDCPAIARDYESNGAAGVSVLTDERFFSGSLEDLKSVRDEVRLPVLRKDFIIHEYQIAEARAYGADAVLLIAAILERSQLLELSAAAAESGLESLVELYDESEIDILDLDLMKLIGINNRDLRTFSVDVCRSIAMAEKLPDDATLVSESGIRTPDDLRRLKDAGIRAALIGEYFMLSEKPGRTLQQLLQEFSNAPSR
jgi:indole-3-glycerol phosphate synthase